LNLANPQVRGLQPSRQRCRRRARDPGVTSA